MLSDAGCDRRGAAARSLPRRRGELAAPSRGKPVTLSRATPRFAKRAAPCQTIGRKPLESPYRPPSEVDASDASSMPLAPGNFRLEPDGQRIVGRLAKYLSDIGGLLIFVSVLALLSTLLSGLFTLRAGAVPSMILQLVQQALNIVFLFLIGRFMRQAAFPLRGISETVDGHTEKLMESMLSLKSLYGMKILYLVLGILITILMLFL